MHKMERRIKNAEKELEIIKPFLEKYGFQLNLVKFFADRLRLTLRSKRQ